MAAKGAGKVENELNGWKQKMNRKEVVVRSLTPQWTIIQNPAPFYYCDASVAIILYGIAVLTTTFFNSISLFPIIQMCAHGKTKNIE